MTARARRLEVSPAWIGSLALHVGVAAAFMISWGARDLKVGSVVPVTIVANAPEQPKAAEQADTAENAAVEEPAPVPPEPVPPPPPTKSAKTPPPAPTPAPTPKPTKPEKSFDFDKLASTLTAPARNTPQRPTTAPTGPTRQSTAPNAQTSPDSGLLASRAAITGLTDELQRRWNPNCTVEGGRDVMVRVVFQMGVGGQVVGEPTFQIQGPRTPVSQAGAERAVRAVYAAAPFRGLPREFYGERIAVTFSAREACAL